MKRKQGDVEPNNHKRQKRVLLSESTEYKHVWDLVDMDECRKLNIDPFKLTTGSNRLIRFRCSAGHTFDRQVQCMTRNAHTTCRMCTPRVSSTDSELKTEYVCNSDAFKHLMAEIDIDECKRRNIDPNQVRLGSKTDVPFRCSRGHLWSCRMRDRTGHNQKKREQCPTCAPVNQPSAAAKGVRLCESAAHVPIWKELDADDCKAQGIDPTKLKLRSTKKIGWICGVCNNRWRTKVYARAAGTGCPVCYRRTRESITSVTLDKRLRAMGFETKKSFPDLRDDRLLKLSYYRDATTDCKRPIAIEFDVQGRFRRSGSKKDLSRLRHIYMINEYCKNRGICLLRISSTEKYATVDSIVDTFIRDAATAYEPLIRLEGMIYEHVRV